MPYILPLKSINSSSQTEIDNWEAISLIYNQASVDETLTKQVYGNNLTIKVNTTSTSDNITFFSKINGTLSNQSTGDYLTINSSTTFTFEKSTGILKLFKDFQDIEGVITGNYTVAKRNIEIERTSYTPLLSSSSSSSSSSLSSNSSLSSSSSSSSAPTTSSLGFTPTLTFLFLSLMGGIIYRRRKKKS